MFLKIVRIVTRLILRIIARVELHNFDRIPDAGGCIVVSNHLGRLDAMLGMILTDREDVIMMVAEKYQAYAFWRFAVRQMDAIWLNRHEADFHALRLVKKRLKAGGIAAIAPEGTRSAQRALQPGKPGAAWLAAQTGVPLVPVGITGTEDAEVTRRLRRLRRLHIVVRVGEPFTLPPMDRRERDAYLQRSTDEIMRRIAALLPPEYRGVYAGQVEAPIDSGQ